ncbi:MAG: hypothetical protein K0R28_2357 [Paenibacillus sp.]|nr:hypothetical protein [Paenibacillus sp.]
MERLGRRYAARSTDRPTGEQLEHTGRVVAGEVFLARLKPVRGEVSGAAGGGKGLVSPSAHIPEGQDGDVHVAVYARASRFPPCASDCRSGGPA